MVRVFSRHSGRLRLVAACLTAVYLIASLGVVPSPAYLASLFGGALRVAAGAGRFPCDDHACGCVSASECWLHCCCHTPQQRLVWAVTHGVRPPPAVKFTRAQWAAAVEAARSDSTSEANAGGVPVCDSSRQPVRGYSLSALACKGIQQILAASVPPALPRRVGEMMTVPVAVLVIAPPRHGMPDSRSLEVPEPPPRKS